VGELTERIAILLEDVFSRVAVVGEISNLRRPGSGHVYLTLKDRDASLGAVMWRSTAARIRFDPEDGLEVVARGRLAVYAPQGKYQLVVDSIRPRGVGALDLAFQQLRTRLAEEGLFDPDRKKPLPFLPRRIGLVTSPTGAAVRDMVRVIRRRFPPARILVIPVRVQGEGAAEEIAAALDSLGRDPRGCDVLVVGRGGGSLEDLWCFNEEVTARAIVRCPIPVVSAVGHETDVSIADLVADRRAATPTEAGEIVVPRLDRLRGDVAEGARRLRRAVRDELRAARLLLAQQGRRLSRSSPRRLLEQRRQRLDELAERTTRAVWDGLERRRERLAAVAGRLEAVNPLRVLARGYSLTKRAGERTCLLDAADLAVGDEIETRLARGGSGRA
jgi:exodeoxyribonuclease VII large subunit